MPDGFQDDDDINDFVPQNLSQRSESSENKTSRLRRSEAAMNLKRNVRSKYDPTVKNPILDAARSPLEHATTTMTKQTETLQKGIAQYLQERGQDFLKLAHKYYQKILTMNRLTEKEYIPMSLRFKAELTSTPSIMKGAEFESISESAEDLKREYQRLFKDHIREVVTLETNALEQELINLFTDAIQMTIKIYLITGKRDAHKCNDYVLFLLNNHYNELDLKLFGTQETMITSFVGRKNLTNDTYACPDGADVLLVQSALDTILHVFKSSLAAYIEKMTYDETQLTIKARIEETLSEQSTAAAADYANSETNTSREQLDELIRRQCDNAIKSRVDAILNKRLQQEGSKNFSRGKSSASQKKKKGTTNTRKKVQFKETTTPSKTSKKKKHNNSEGAADGDTTKKQSGKQNKKNKQKPGANTSRKKKTGSNKNQRR